MKPRFQRNGADATLLKLQNLCDRSQTFGLKGSHSNIDWCLFGVYFQSDPNRFARLAETI
jgi:hypothetical protein